MGLWAWGERAVGRIGDGFNAAGDALNKAADAVIDAGEAFLDNPSEALANAGNAVLKANDWVNTKINKGAAYLWENRGNIIEGTGSFIVSAVWPPLRAQIMLTQGLTKGVASMGGMLVDAGRGLARHTYNLGAAEEDKWTNKPNVDTNGDGIIDEHDQYQGFSQRWRRGTGELTDKVINPLLDAKIPFTNIAALGGSERNLNDKIWGYTGEVAAEVATIVVTGGAAGAVFGTMRATAATARMTVVAMNRGKSFGQAVKLANRYNRMQHFQKTTKAAATIAAANGAAGMPGVIAGATETSVTTGKNLVFLQNVKNLGWGRRTAAAINPLKSSPKYVQHLNKKAADIVDKANKVRPKPRGLFTSPSAPLSSKDLARAAAKKQKLLGKAEKIRQKSNYIAAPTATGRIAGRADYMAQHLRLFPKARAAIYRATAPFTHKFYNGFMNTALWPAVAARALLRRMGLRSGPARLTSVFKGGTYAPRHEVILETAGGAALVASNEMMDKSYKQNLQIAEDLRKGQEGQEQEIDDDIKDFLDDDLKSSNAPAPSDKTAQNPNKVSETFGKHSSLRDNNARLATSPYTATEEKSALEGSFKPAAKPQQGVAGLSIFKYKKPAKPDSTAEKDQNGKKDNILAPTTTNR